MKQDPAVSRVEFLEKLKNPTTWPSMEAHPPGRVLRVWNRVTGEQGVVVHNHGVTIPRVWLVDPLSHNWKITDLRPVKRRVRRRRGHGKRYKFIDFASLSDMVHSDWCEGKRGNAFHATHIDELYTMMSSLTAANPAPTVTIPATWNSYHWNTTSHGD